MNSSMWTNSVGLINVQFNYLTAENFGHKINVNGTAMKKKQQWSLELFPMENETEDMSEYEFVAIKSHLDRYLAVDDYGNVTCDQLEKNDKCRFIITVCSMSNSKQSEQIYWAFKNVERNYYLGGANYGIVTCNAKMPQSRAELWHVHLIPSKGATFFSLKSIGRKRFAQAIDQNQTKSDSPAYKEKIQVDATDSWGVKSLFHLKYFEGSNYALVSYSGNYLNNDGYTVSWQPKDVNRLSNGNAGSPPPLDLPPEDCLFTIEFHAGYIAFRGKKGRYLAVYGHDSILKSFRSKVSKDELFEFHCAPIQIALKATFNNKWVSMKQGVDLSANQNESSDTHETFQIEYNAEYNLCNICTKQGNYWTLTTNSIAASSKDVKNAAYFDLKWNEDGTCSLLATMDPSQTNKEQMKWICNRKSGQLFTCSQNSDQEPVHFQLKIQNRPYLNLRVLTSSGFIGLKNVRMSKLDSNKVTPDAIMIEYAGIDSDKSLSTETKQQACIATDSATSPVENSVSFNYCYFKMPANNKYWSIDGNVVSCDASTQACAQQWIIELQSNCSIRIRTLEPCNYLAFNSNGILLVNTSLPSAATEWEF